MARNSEQKQWIPVTNSTKTGGVTLLYFIHEEGRAGLTLYDQETSCELFFNSIQDRSDFIAKWDELQKALIDFFDTPDLQHKHLLQEFLAKFVKRGMNGLI